MGTRLCLKTLLLLSPLVPIATAQLTWMGGHRWWRSQCESTGWKSFSLSSCLEREALERYFGLQQLYIYYSWKDSWDRGEITCILLSKTRYSLKLKSSEWPPSLPSSGTAGPADRHREVFCSEGSEEGCSSGRRWRGEHYGREKDPCTWLWSPLSHPPPLDLPDSSEWATS